MAIEERVEQLEADIRELRVALGQVIVLARHDSTEAYLPGTAEAIALGSLQQHFGRGSPDRRTPPAGQSQSDRSTRLRVALACR
jgi:hypothetical protein